MDRPLGLTHYLSQTLHHRRRNQCSTPAPFLQPRGIRLWQAGASPVSGDLPDTPRSIDLHQEIGRGATGVVSHKSGIRNVRQMYSALLESRMIGVTAALHEGDNSIVADAPAIMTWPDGLFRDGASYDKFLACRGTAAQQLLDRLQDLLDYDSPSMDRRRCFETLKRLSGRSGLHPRCFALPRLELVGDRVAGGGFSDVYRASLRGKNVAVKVIRAFNETDIGTAVKRFGQEAVIWRQLSHPNVVPFFGLYYLDRKLCLVSPWMENGDMQTFLKNCPCDINHRISFASIMDVASGVKHLHEKDVVHGDLKTANVLVTSSRRACITDFGLSSIVIELSSFQHTNPSIRARGGTVRYQAPELLKGGQNDSRSDVFAFAIVAYELLTGKLPFHELPREGAVIAALLAGSRPSPTEDIHPVLWALIQDCWEEQPEMRPTAAQVVERLRIPALASAALAGSTTDWDDTLTSRFRRSLHPERSSPTVMELEGMILEEDAAVLTSN
ncbi:Protein kinase domain-containing protein [Mycena sanguinolenta]|uniref:Protein kinase domain-containing protein n=1 Tax=Mycena sanguinolenta TaxID=230812 RepID=A0A8H6XUN1_9AGAR|nr:Protein kinase domain-containing protein [Mycena sanguinolenta]